MLNTLVVGVIGPNLHLAYSYGMLVVLAALVVGVVGPSVTHAFPW